MAEQMMCRDYGLLCPKCGYHQSSVVDSRPSGSEQRRRRECLKCGERFTTYEVMEHYNRRKIYAEVKEELLDNLRFAMKDAIIKTFK